MPLVVLCAGGTGGHLFPAEALAIALTKRGVEVDLATDARAAAYAGAFPARRRHAIPSETFRSRSPGAVAATLWKLGTGALSAYAMLGREKPSAVVGFGGYPTVPPLMAATWRRIPTLIHEQNAVMGRANRLLQTRVSAIATGFPEVAAVDPSARAKLVFTGNPVRPAVIAAAATPYATATDRLRLLVFGGSQGARVMSDVVPAAMALLEPALKARLAIVQQARDEDVERVTRAYREAGVSAEIAPFFSDLPARMAAADFVIARGGASTVAELAVIGRPSILVPLPGALDQDQAANARALAAAGGTRVVMQTDFTPQSLAATLSATLADQAGLVAMAAAARATGRADAAERLADVVLDLIARKRR